MGPDPAPLATWRGAPLTHEAAEDLFIGWLREDATSALLPTLLREAGGDGASSSSGGSGGGEAYSWRVFAGKSAAYDVSAAAEATAPLPESSLPLPAAYCLLPAACR